MKKNFKGHHDGIRCANDRLERLEKQVGDLTDMFKELRDDLKLVVQRSTLDKMNINSYFPISNDDSLAEFMSDSDGLFKRRCLQFEEMLLSVCRAPGKGKLTTLAIRNFNDQLLTALFTREYCRDHRWYIHK